ncbi:choline/ethanolamine kinase [Kluyveromyces lactis]|uniref:KLLA0D16500p n=1 Tax=Kluyveromyces lactis (strain ATCC 8585 / CBS 2359 / DSM 70799 / NBRC 1267 / NRRL Y-1140 / WM37) TaxID=284590 RepID=Q6CQK1_KLULA|nr:uncharacterized protein KLLA0_D16500g [Kluyveromyces lactis]CAH00884.1 KLLA0D16500p [Kluyveromyces lactis]|eukprot:XP_453788.1 uncharacterized protein KLLA0_D16500g [Kluyveromyces lactis]
MIDLRPTRSIEKGDATYIRSRSHSKTRKPSLPRRNSSSRSIKTIPIELEKEGPATPQSLVLGESISVPYVKSTLDISLPHDLLQEDFKNLIIALRVKHWYKHDLDASMLRFTRISGAMTNAIFKVEYDNLPSLLVRVYGPNVESVIDREYELQVLARLSIQHIGPSLYGCFENGRIEQFLENSHTLTKSDIRDWKTSQRIARRMKELHSGVPLLSKELKDEPATWKRIEKWTNTLAKSSWIQDNDNINKYLMVSSWDQFLSIVAKYKKWLQQKPSYRKLVFCHNDAQYGNLLFAAPVIPVTADSEISQSVSNLSISESNSSLFPSSSHVSLEEIINPSIQEQAQDAKLVVIDFEYGGPNPPAFDLANHLSEWMHDYNCSTPYVVFHDRFPTHEEMLNFIYSYLSHLNPKRKHMEEEVCELYNDILDWRGSVSLHWALWGIIQSGELTTEIDESEKTEEGPGGEKYIITVDKLSSPTIDGDDSGEEENAGVDIDTFEYLLYSKNKLEIFYSDLIQLNVIDKSEVLNADDLKVIKMRRL